MPDTPKTLDAKRMERRRLNRLSRVRAAVDAGDEATHLMAAYEFARAAIKRRPLEERDGHRRALAELITNYALNDLDSSDITRLESVA